MIVVNENIIKSYRTNHNKDGFCIGDKVKYANEDKYWYVVGVNRLYIVLGYFDGDRLVTITESFPNINLKTIKKCMEYPDLIIDRFENMFNKEEIISLITWLESYYEKDNYKKIEMNFFEAMQELEKGNKIRNTTWREDYYIFIDKDNLLTDSNGLAYEMHIESYDDLKYFLWWNKGSWEIFE